MRAFRVLLADRRDAFFREPFRRDVFARLDVRFLAIRPLPFLPALRFGAFAFLREALRDFAFLGRAGRGGLGVAGGGVGV